MEVHRIMELGIQPRLGCAQFEVLRRIGLDEKSLGVAGPCLAVERFGPEARFGGRAGRLSDLDWPRFADGAG